LEPIAADLPRVIARAARDDMHVLDFAEQLERARTERFGHDAAVDDAAVKRVGERAGLVVDFLQHEAPVRALLGRFGVPLRLVHVAPHDVAFCIEYANGLAADLGDVALLEIDEALRDRQQRGHAARDEVLADTEADHERLAIRVTTSRSGSSASKTSSAYAPTKRLVAWRTASSSS